MKAPSCLAWASRWIVCLAFLASGCQLLFGDYKVVPAAAGGAAGVAGTSRVVTCEANGTYRCQGSTLQICEDHTWTERKICPTAVQCNEPGGNCHTCEPSSWQCSSFKLQQCLPSGDGWLDKDRCIREVRCNATTQACDKCETGEAECDGQYLKLCNEDRTDWVITDCIDPNLCNTASRDCRKCAAGVDFQCRGSTLLRCNKNSQWETAETCENAELCRATLESRTADPTAWDGSCNAPACEAGDHRCNPANPAELQECPPSRVAWSTIETCYTAELCDANAGACKPGCAPGTYRCEGASLEQCLGDGTGWERTQLCSSSNQCDAENRICHACTAGEYGCKDEVLRQCSANREWVTVKACASPELCTLRTEGSCRAPGCPKAGQYRCNGKALEVCPASLIGWELVKTCETEGLCSAERGVCNEPICKAAWTIECQGNIRRQCDDMRATWKTLNTCGANQICSVVQGCLGECPNPDRQCSGRLLEQCKVEAATQTPKWETVSDCFTAGLCDSEKLVCVEPTCDTNGYRCFSQQLRKCNANRTGWDVVKDCAAGQTCDAGGQQCDVCTADQYSCSGTDLLRCKSDGQQWNISKSNCVRCAASTDKTTGTCYVCNAGDQQCAQQQIQTCSADGLSWNSPSDCAPGYGCEYNEWSARHDYCAVCPVAGQTNCTADKTGLHKCSDDRSSWSSTTDCPYGCHDNALGNDVCDTACPAGTSRCEQVEGSSTGLNTCKPDGSGWLGITQQCANSTTLKLCVGGAFSSTQSVACPAEKPLCVGVHCVQCNATKPECSDLNTVSRACVNGAWVDTQCAGTCNPEAGLCVECTPPGTPTCVNGARHYCGADYKWHTDPCPAACASGACVECSPNTDWSCKTAATRERCADNVIETEECLGATPACSGGQCVQCAGSTDCSAPTGVCSGNTCVECAVSSDCKDPTKNSCSGNKCVQCAGNTDCSAPTGVCSGNTCVECAASPDCKDPTKRFCSANTCVECAENADCQEPPRTICAASKCVECTVRGDCPPAKPVCASGTCSTCSVDSECAILTPATPYCVDAACVACRNSTNCGGELICEGGTCVPNPVLPDAGAGATAGASG